MKCTVDLYTERWFMICTADLYSIRWFMRCTAEKWFMKCTADLYSERWLRKAKMYLMTTKMDLGQERTRSRTFITNSCLDSNSEKMS